MSPQQGHTPPSSGGYAVGQREPVAGTRTRPRVFGSEGAANAARRPLQLPRLFVDDDLDQISLGLRHLAQAQSRMRELLNAVLSISSTLELPEVLRTIVDASRELVDARYGALGIVDETGDFAELIASGPGIESLARQAGEPPHAEGLLGGLVRNLRPLRLDDVAAHPDATGFPEGHPVMTTLLGVPILVRGTVYGNLYLADKTTGTAFTDTDQDIVTALASAAGVAIENARLYQQLRQVTEDFQRRLLPELPTVPGLEVQTRYRPSSDRPHVGGDWYDLITLPGKGHCLVVGDVMGHDSRAAAVMSRISNALRVIAYDRGESPHRVLEHLDKILEDLNRGSTATVIVARVEEHDDGRWLRWSSAGHPPPLLVTADGEASQLPQPDQGLPLGVDPGLSRPEYVARLPEGSTLLLYTDGLVETAGHPLEHGVEDLARCAAEVADLPLSQLCDALLAHRGGAFRDDVALLAARLV